MKLIILDRDGVINEDSDDFIRSPEDWVPIPGSLEAISRLYRGGYRVIVTTNQSGVGRGLLSIEDLHQIHAKMSYQLDALGGAIDAVFYCPHHPDDRCDCRKPKPGMLLDIAARLRIPLTGVPAVGDSRRDLEAAVAAGASPILVRTGKGARTLLEHPDLTGFPVFPDLQAVADALLAGR